MKNSIKTLILLANILTLASCSGPSSLSEENAALLIKLEKLESAYSLKDKELKAANIKIFDLEKAISDSIRDRNIAEEKNSLFFDSFYQEIIEARSDVLNQARKQCSNWAKYATAMHDCASDYSDSKDDFTDCMQSNHNNLSYVRPDLVD